MSNERGFGFCGFNSLYRPEVPVPTNFAEGCSVHYGDQPCVLLELVPDAFPETTAGWLTLQAQCLDYRSHFPESVRCWTPDGELIP